MAEKKPEYIPAVIDGDIKYCERREFKGEQQEGYSVDIETMSDKGRPVILRGFSEHPQKKGPFKGLKVQLGVVSCRI